MTHYSQSRRLTPVFSPTRHELERHSTSQNYNTYYADTNYHGQQIALQPTQPSSPMQGLENRYQPYTQDTRRPQHMYHSAENHQISPYVPESMLPPVQQPVTFGSFTEYQPRGGSVLDPVTSTFQMTPYLPLTGQNTICIPASPVQYLPSHSDQHAYSSPSVCRSDVAFTPITGEAISHSLAVVQMEEEQHCVEADPHLDLQQYEEQLRSTFEALIAGRLDEVADRLLDMLRSLMSSIVTLGLHLDDPNEYNRRASLWREFNHSWEALAQKQKTLILEKRSQSHKFRDAVPLSPEKIKHLVDELIFLCDQIDQYGLVDYEVGIWEDQIISAFEVCLDLMGQDEEEISRGLNRSEIGTK